MEKELSPFILTVCQNLRKLRESQDVKQEELAAAINISIPTLSKIENGYDVSLTTIERICNYLGKDIGDVIQSSKNTFYFSECTNSNGNYFNYLNKELFETLQKELDFKNQFIKTLIDKNM